MSKIIEVIKGAFMGIANVIPGLSGGTIAIIFKIYDKLLDAMSTVFRHPIKVIKSILYIGIGIGIGIVIAIFGVTYFYDKYPVPTTFLFLGLVLGGIPFILKEVNLKKINFKKVLIFLALFSFTAVIPFLSGNDKNINDVTFMNGIILFLIGLIAAGTMVVPGVSGSMILICLGYYESVMNLLKSFITNALNFNFGALFSDLLLVLPFIIGIGIGIILVAKLIKYLLFKSRELTFFAILGLIFASPIGIIYNIENFNVNSIQIIATILLFGFGLIIPYLIENKLVKKFEGISEGKKE